MIRYAIFDLDGTLLYTLRALSVSMNLTLEKFGLGPISEEQARQFIGDGYRKFCERSLLACGDEKLAHYEESLPLYLDNLAAHSMDGVVPFEGIPELLDGLKKRGIRLAVFSNKPDPQAKSNIATAFGPDCFDMVIGEQEGLPKKPDPAGVFRILEAFGEVPEHGLYFGDSNVDMKTGLAAGLNTVGVLWGYRGLEELAACHPQALIAAPADILEKIDEGCF